MDCFKELFEEFLRLLPVFALAILGGSVNYLNRPKEQFSWWWLAVEILTAAFVGLVVHLLLQATSWPEGIRAASVAVSGYSSRDVLFLLRTRLLQKLGQGDLP